MPVLPFSLSLLPFSYLVSIIIALSPTPIRLCYQEGCLFEVKIWLCLSHLKIISRLFLSCKLNIYSKFGTKGCLTDPLLLSSLPFPSLFSLLKLCSTQRKCPEVLNALAIHAGETLVPSSQNTPHCPYQHSSCE